MQQRFPALLNNKTDYFLEVLRLKQLRESKVNSSGISSIIFINIEDTLNYSLETRLILNQLKKNPMKLPIQPLYHTG